MRHTDSGRLESYSSGGNRVISKMIDRPKRCVRCNKFGATVVRAFPRTSPLSARCSTTTGLVLAPVSAMGLILGEARPDRPAAREISSNAKIGARTNYGPDPSLDRALSLHVARGSTLANSIERRPERLAERRVLPRVFGPRSIALTHRGLCAPAVASHRFSPEPQERLSARRGGQIWNEFGRSARCGGVESWGPEAHWGTPRRAVRRDAWICVGCRRSPKPAFQTAG